MCLHSFRWMGLRSFSHSNSYFSIRLSLQWSLISAAGAESTREWSHRGAIFVEFEVRVIQDHLFPEATFFSFFFCACWAFLIYLSVQHSLRRIDCYFQPLLEDHCLLPTAKIFQIFSSHSLSGPCCSLFLLTWSLCPRSYAIRPKCKLLYGATLVHFIIYAIMPTRTSYNNKL